MSQNELQLKEIQCQDVLSREYYGNHQYYVQKS